ncbi:tol-pal system protein YbgF [Roseimaritima multifibrata]|uniref:Tol-pal system protein YbgF n=1 Tax=Roseimaritima multifibrata TaxID=1930274 RepID=A0A517MMT0_9BACT|nr:tetratricopeptide repeat protein [Roseimaritima multifibrata]QDS96189.1 tol-pal system protein YbgF [Roseimaritima multifibrata]
MKRKHSANRTFAWLIGILLVATVQLGYAQDAEKSSDEAIAKYADAANFQTNAAMDLAITAWEEFLSQYANDPLAPKAAHYLGVCYMQREMPDYKAAAAAFAKALADKKYDLREESFANRGWCLYAASGQGVEPGEARDPKLLKETIQTFQQLSKEYPKSDFLDQAYFFSGEAAYALGDSKQAIRFYDQLLKWPKAAESPLRCDTLYARGVAQEELKDYAGAVQAYKGLLESCAESDAELAEEVRVRMGDVLLLQKDNAAAVTVFAEAAKQGGSNAPYARFRQAFALAQSGDSAGAAKTYEQLIKEFPDSKYSSAAVLASAQSSYVAGDIEAASKRFREVLNQPNQAEATEAAHWLAQIALRKGSAEEAEKVAAEQIKKGVAGQYALALKLDQAEAVSLLPGKAKESLDLFAAVYREDPNSSLAPRALYSAAFAALQSGSLQQAVDLSGQFLKRYEKDPLRSDVRYIDAEAKLLAGSHAEAAKAYEALLKETDENPQRSVWILRAITAHYLAGQYDSAIELAKAQMVALQAPAEKAEAQFLVGASHLFAQRPQDAISGLQESLKLDAEWAKASEAMLLLGQAQLQAEDAEAAVKTWQKLVATYPKNRMADQAYFRLGQQAAGKQDFPAAIAAYAQILKRDSDPGLIPYALFNQGWCFLQQDKLAEAKPLLKRMLDEYESHPLRNQTQLAYGITLRKASELPEAEKQLTAILDTNPQGISLGHALYELAQIDIEKERHAEAVVRLQRIVDEVPQYPTTGRVLYDLAWSLKEAGEEAEAAKAFENLIQKDPDNPLAAEASYFIGEQQYAARKWKESAAAFGRAAELSKDPELAEKGLYNQGWSLFRQPDFAAAEKVFADQVTRFPEGKLILDGLLMTGESRFKLEQFELASQAYQKARERIEANDESSKTIDSPEQRQIRELVYLHGGQSLGQLEKWKESVEWFDTLRSRFPNTNYLPQAFFQTAYASQQLGDEEQALKLYNQVASKYRDETAARSRFMMGEVYFGRRDMAKAIPEFQRVMYGFGADKAPAAIKNWQAKSGFEAGRCAELLIQSTQGARRDAAIKYAREFFGFVIEKHPDHELAAKAKERMEVLQRL